MFFQDNFLFRALTALMAFNTSFWSWFNDKPLWIKIVTGVVAAFAVWFVLKIITGLLLYIVIAGLVVIAISYFKA